MKKLLKMLTTTILTVALIANFCVSASAVILDGNTSTHPEPSMPPSTMPEISAPAKPEPEPEEKESPNTGMPGVVTVMGLGILAVGCIVLAINGKEN